MSNQFSAKRFARGVKLTVEHQSDPLEDIKAAAATASVESTAEANGCCVSSWQFAWIGPGAVESEFGAVYAPFTLPPFQQLFDRATLRDPQYQVRLADLCLSVDQRAEPLAVVGPHSTSQAGDLTAADMSRLDVTLRLLERQPSLLTGETLLTREVLRFDLPGVEVFGSGSNGTNIIRSNPFLARDLNVSLKPFGVYIWELTCPGLYSLDGGTIDVWNCTVGGAFVPGDTARLSIGATNYDYLVVFGDTATTIATAIAALAVSDPFYEVTSAGAVVTLRSRRVSLLAAVASLFLAGAGTFVAANTIPGAAGTVEQLMLPSLTLTASFVSPLTVRDSSSDFAAPGVQNIPSIHLGNRLGTTIPLAIPAGNALITGDDIQGQNHGFDRALRQRLGSGYGVGYGALANPMQASDIAPRAIVKNDAHYQMIVVPMWGGQFRESLRAQDVPQAGLPYILASDPAPGWTEPTMDRRLVPVPDGFVLHHAFAVWNLSSPASPAIYGRSIEGVVPLSPDYEQKVGIGLNSGLRADDYLFQQIAYLEWTGAVYTPFMLDEWSPGIVPVAYRLMQIPLVAPAAQLANSWFDNGLPFYMGKANTMTQPRQDAGALPNFFGGGAYANPVTDGKENVLEIRWSKRDSVNGLHDTANPNDVRVGQGGEWVILLGKQAVGG